MARTELNSSAIPAGTVVSSDLTFPLTDFSSTGIDDNASSVAITVDSSGRVGIGNTSPDAGLVVHDNAGLVVATSAIARQTYTSVGDLQIATSGSGGILIHSGASNIGYITFGDGAVAGRIAYNHNDNTMYFYTDNNNERMRLLDGPVLQFTDAVTTGTTIGEKGTKILLKSDSSTAGNGGEIVWTGNADEGGERWAAISGSIRENSVDGCAGDIQFSTKEQVTANTMSERMRICANGDIGIGTTDPAAKLDVRANTNSTIRISNDGDSIAKLYFRNTGSSDGQITQEAGDMFFQIAGDKKIELRNDGNFGIGQLNPDARLSVATDQQLIARLASSNTSITGVRLQGYDASAADTVYVDWFYDAENRQYGFGEGTASGSLPINSGIGQADVVINDGNVRITSEDGLSSLSITDNPLTLGSLTAFNLAFDSNEIQARNNGASNNLILNKNGGSVGIGKIPTYRLDVSSGADEEVARFQSTASFADVYLQDNGTSTGQVRLRAQSNTLKFITNTTERMQITSGGRVFMNEGPSATFGGFGTEPYGGMNVYPDAGFVAINADTTNSALYLAKTAAATAGYINFATAGTTRGAIVESGTNIGIQFGGTATGAHTFDDYEEGTWTPSMSTSAFDGAYSMTVQKAVFRKIGATVFYSAYISAINVTTQGTGNMRIYGLPFTASSEGNSYSGGVSVYGTMIKHTRVHINAVSGTYLRLIHHEPEVSGSPQGEFDMSAGELGTGSKGSWIFQGFYTTD